MSDLEKVVFSVDIRSETRFSVRKIIQQLYINGLKVESTEMGMKFPDTIFQQISGSYPGGQKALDSKINEIRKETGPCIVPAKFNPFEFTSNGDVSDRLQKFGFKIISQHADTYELEYKHGYDEACCRLGDALLELFGENNLA